MAARYLSFAPWILHVVADEDLVLLDARSNRFLLFGRDTTGEIVAAVEGQPKSPLVEALLAEGALQSAPSMISLNRSRAAGLDDFTWSESVRYKTLYHASCPSTREVLAAGLSLAKACLLLKCVSLCRLLRRDHSSLASSAPAKSIVDLEITALLRATRWLPCKIACLEFSLALRERLAHHGVNGTVEIGVQKYSFMAHAWLEVNGEPLGEPDYVARSLHRLRGTE